MQKRKEEKKLTELILTWTLLAECPGRPQMKRLSVNKVLKMRSLSSTPQVGKLIKRSGKFRRSAGQFPFRQIRELYSFQKGRKQELIDTYTNFTVTLHLTVSPKKVWKFFSYSFLEQFLANKTSLCKHTIKNVSLKKETLHDATYLPVYFWKQKQEVLLKMLR